MFYTGQVRLNWKSARLAMLALLAILGLFSTGCSGVNAGGSVSPAMFFIPGAKANPPAAATPAAVAAITPSLLLASAQ
jgi:hypothetical protein